MKKYLKITDQNGVTLIETLLVMGLMSAMLIVLATIFTSAIDVQQSSSSYSATTTSGRFIIAKLNYDITHATAILTPNTPGSTSANLIVAANNTSYLYGLSGNNFAITEDARQYSLNNDDVTVSNVSFHEYGSGTDKPMIVYSFTLTSNVKSHGTSDVQTFTDSVGLR